MHARELRLRMLIGTGAREAQQGARTQGVIETSSYGKRDLFIWQKRPTSVMCIVLIGTGAREARQGARTQGVI